MNDQVEQAGRVALRTGRVAGALVCLALVGLGLLVGSYLARAAWVDLEPRFWKPVDGRILRSELRDPSSPKASRCSVIIRYAYEWESRNYISGRIYRKHRTFPNAEHAQQLVERYQVATSVICRVNPARPNEAVLEAPFPWLTLALMLPGFMIAVGAIGCYHAVFFSYPRRLREAEVLTVESAA